MRTARSCSFLAAALLLLSLSGCYTPTRRKIDIPVSKKGFIRVRLSNSTRVAWAYLLVDGKNHGTIRRGRTRRIPVSSDAYHSVYLKRNWRGGAFRARWAGRIYPGKTRYVVLKPVQIN